MEFQGWASILFLLSYTWIPGFVAGASEYTLNIGVYCPSGTFWRKTISRGFQTQVSGMIQEAMRRDPTATLKIELFYLTATYAFTLKDIEKAKQDLRKDGISVIIGPYEQTLLMVAENQSIPYLVTSEHPQQAMESWNHTFFMLPEKADIHTAILDVIDAFEWKDNAVIYDSSDGLQLVEAMMTRRKLSIRAWKTRPEMEDDELREQLLEIRQLELRRVVVLCTHSLVNHIIKVALKLSMLSNKYTWLIVNLDPHVLDYEPYKYTQVNLTTFQLYDCEVGNMSLPRGVEHLPLALAVDALTTVASGAVDILRTERAHCGNVCPNINKRITGEEMQPRISQVTEDGMTGRIQFDEENFRTNLTLKIMFLTEDGIKKITHLGLPETGGWYNEYHSVKKRLQLEVANKPAPQSSKTILGREGLVRIVTIFDDPFVMWAKDHETKTGNARFQGYLIDLIAEIGRRMGFEYELYLSPDGNYGSKNVTTKQWNGMIHELIMGHAAMCLGAISITSEREEAIDFTKPFKQKEFNILMKKPKEKTSIFQFLWPLHAYVWITTIGAMILVSMLLFTLDRITPNSLEKSQRFGFRESVWFIYASLVGVGTDNFPKTLSARLLSGAWWFFSLILLSSYTANLAAFLTVTKIDTPIKNIQDLAAQTTIKYGTVRNTYAMSMFRSAEMAIFKKMWEHMSKLHPDNLVDNSSAGLMKVKSENYAFIWDSPINKYTALHDCDVMALGEPFDEKGYGIGVPLGAPYRDQITMEILSLSESDFMMKLTDKWWGEGKCAEFKETSTKNKELEFHNVAGIFVVLGFGACLGVVVAALEYMVKCLQKRHKKRFESEMERDSSTVALRPSHVPSIYTYSSTHTADHNGTNKGLESTC